MNYIDHLLGNNIDAPHIVGKDHDIIHEDDLDDDFKEDMGLEYESTSQTTSTLIESNSPQKIRSNLDDVIESVIQDALNYADAPQDKCILPPLLNKSITAAKDVCPEHVLTERQRTPIKWIDRNESRHVGASRHDGSLDLNHQMPSITGEFYLIHTGLSPLNFRFSLLA